jgi:hypothetical protein
VRGRVVSGESGYEQRVGRVGLSYVLPECSNAGLVRCDLLLLQLLQRRFRGLRVPVKIEA